MMLVTGTIRELFSEKEWVTVAYYSCMVIAALVALGVLILGWVRESKGDKLNKYLEHNMNTLIQNMNALLQGLNNVSANNILGDLKIRYIALGLQNEMDFVRRGYILNNNFTKEELKQIGYDDEAILQIQIITDAIYKHYEKIQKGIKEGFDKHEM